MKIAVELQQLQLSALRHVVQKQLLQRKAAFELMTNLIQIIESQNPVFHLLGLQVGESGSKGITIVMGAALSLTIIFVARAEVDLELE